jgi:signal transduction histidine kinase/ActR/RegA family two-component response regulator
VLGQVRPQLGRLIVTPFATIGVLAAVLLWEVEHVGSLLLALVIAAIGIAVGVIVARRLRRDMDDLAGYYEALLRTADEQSRQAEMANRVKDEFLATLSHELRTPLNSILGWAHLLASGKLDAGQHARAVKAIERGGLAQSRLIEDLLDLSRIVSGKLHLTMRPTVVQPLVVDAVDSLRPAAEAKDIAIGLTLDASIGPTSADPDRVQQMVWNLVSNAIKFTPSHGRVDVRLDRQGDHMSLLVQDTGIGFDPDVATRLFERFRQGDSSSTRQYAGLGLGLGIVRHLAELHGGTVDASSEGDNKGSMFRVRLPIRPVEAPIVDVPFAATGPTLRGVSVLVVDDDPQSLEFARSTLEQYGAIVVAASSAREARQRFAHDPTDVIVSDLMMPGEDGLQLIHAIREIDAKLDRRTPAAALTGLARTEDRRRALSAGYQMHIAKPIDPFELVSTVERLAREPRGSVHAES